jgi:hypothetical protein
MKDEKSIRDKVALLEQKLQEDISMQKKLDIKDEILLLKMELNEAPMPTPDMIECVNCGS